MIKRDNPWVTLSRERRYEDRYLGVDLDQLRHESGREHPHVALLGPHDHRPCNEFRLTRLHIDDVPVVLTQIGRASCRERV